MSWPEKEVCLKHTNNNMAWLGVANRNKECIFCRGAYERNRAIDLCREASDADLEAFKAKILSELGEEKLSDCIYSELLNLSRYVMIDEKDPCLVINPITQAPKIGQTVRRLIEKAVGK